MQILFVFVDLGNQDIINVVKYFNIRGEETTVMPLIFFVIFACLLLVCSIGTVSIIDFDFISKNDNRIL